MKNYLSHRTDIINDLEEQISELTVIIEQMNRDHKSAEKLVSDPRVSQHFYGQRKDQYFQITCCVPRTRLST